MPGLRPFLPHSGPFSGPRLAQQAQKCCINLGGIRGTHILQPLLAGQANLLADVLHVLAQEAGDWSILDGRRGRFAGLDHRGFFQALMIFRLLKIFDLGELFNFFFDILIIFLKMSNL